MRWPRILRWKFLLRRNNGGFVGGIWNGQAICLGGRFYVFFGAICSARQEAAAVNPAPQANSPTDTAASPELDALAAKVLAKLIEHKASLVLVAGGADPENKIDVLGASLRDGLNDALGRQAAGIRVISTADVANVLRRNRVSVGMIYCNALSEWIAAYSQADTAVVLRLEHAENGSAAVTLHLFDEREKKVFDKKTKDVVPFAKLDSSIPLKQSQANSFGVEFRAPLKTPAPKTGKNGLSMVQCVYCPHTSPYPEEARRLHVQGTVYLSVTVLPDGTADDISVDRPVGHGLDGASINTILTWRFAPSVDSQGNRLASRVPIENAFQDFGFPVKAAPHVEVLPYP
jgi:TonB family protein